MFFTICGNKHKDTNAQLHFLVWRGILVHLCLKPIPQPLPFAEGKGSITQNQLSLHFQREGAGGWVLLIADFPGLASQTQIIDIPYRKSTPKHFRYGTRSITGLAARPALGCG